MAIVFNCTGCGSKMQAPENLAGQSARCPTCQTVVKVPEQVYEAEESSGPRPAGLSRPQAGSFTDEPLPVPEAQRPCPMCGEMIQAQALKCRYCGEVFDPSLKHRLGGGSELASRGSRLGAALLDGLIGLVLMVPGLIVLFSKIDLKPGERPDVLELLQVDSTATLLLAAAALLYWVVQAILLSTQGQSLAKKMIGIRIVKLDGSEPGFVGAFLLRSFVPGLIYQIPYAVGSIFSLVDVLFIFGEERRCIHDYMAGTRVIDA